MVVTSEFSMLKPSDAAFTDAFDKLVAMDVRVAAVELFRKLTTPLDEPDMAEHELWFPAMEWDHYVTGAFHLGDCVVALGDADEEAAHITLVRAFETNPSVLQDNTMWLFAGALSAHPDVLSTEAKLYASDGYIPRFMHPCVEALSPETAAKLGTAFRFAVNPEHFVDDYIRRYFSTNDSRNPRPSQDEPLAHRYMSPEHLLFAVLIHAGRHERLGALESAARNKHFPALWSAGIVRFLLSLDAALLPTLHRLSVMKAVPVLSDAIMTSKGRSEWHRFISGLSLPADWLLAPPHAKHREDAAPSHRHILAGLRIHPMPDLDGQRQAAVEVIVSHLLDTLPTEFLWPALEHVIGSPGMAQRSRLRQSLETVAPEVMRKRHPVLPPLSLDAAAETVAEEEMSRPEPGLDPETMYRLNISGSSDADKGRHKSPGMLAFAEAAIQNRLKQVNGSHLHDLDLLTSIVLTVAAVVPDALQTIHKKCLQADQLENFWRALHRMTSTSIRHLAKNIILVSGMRIYFWRRTVADSPLAEMMEEMIDHPTPDTAVIKDCKAELADLYPTAASVAARKTNLRHQIASDDLVGAANSLRHLWGVATLPFQFLDNLFELRLVKRAGGQLIGGSTVLRHGVPAPPTDPVHDNSREAVLADLMRMMSELHTVEAWRWILAMLWRCTSRFQHELLRLMNATRKVPVDDIADERFLVSMLSWPYEQLQAAFLGMVSLGWSALSIVERLQRIAQLHLADSPNLHLAGSPNLLPDGGPNLRPASSPNLHLAGSPNLQLARLFYRAAQEANLPRTARALRLYMDNQRLSHDEIMEHIREQFNRFDESIRSLIDKRLVPRLTRLEETVMASIDETRLIWQQVCDVMQMNPAGPHAVAASDDAESLLTKQLVQLSRDTQTFLDANEASRQFIQDIIEASLHIDSNENALGRLHPETVSILETAEFLYHMASLFSFRPDFDYGVLVLPFAKAVETDVRNRLEAKIQRMLPNNGRQQIAGGGVVFRILDEHLLRGNQRGLWQRQLGLLPSAKREHVRRWIDAGRKVFQIRNGSAHRGLQKMGRVEHIRSTAYECLRHFIMVMPHKD